MSNIDKHAVQAVADLKAGYTLGHADVAILNELAHIALASLEAEPVAWLLSGGGAKNNVSFDSGNAYADPLREVTPLYTAPPAPVALTSGYSDFEEIWSSSTHPLTQDDEMKDFAWDIWNACRAAMLQGAEPAQEWIPCSERMPEKGRTLALFGKRIKEVCANYVDEGYIGDDGEFYFFDWEGGPRIDDCHMDDKAIVTHWMYWELPAAPKGEHRDAYDIEAFGIFSATEGENGLMLQIERFRFGTEKCPQIGKVNMVPKFALQGVINRLQEHCDSMGNEALVDILSTPAAPQQETK